MTVETLGRVVPPGRTPRWALLLWLPLLLAMVIVLTAPTATAGFVDDSRIYVQQATDIRSGDVPTGRYPPGLALVIAAGDVAGLVPPQVMQLVVMALVALVVVTARRLGGPVAGAVAGLLCCVSPWLTAASGHVMSDPLAAAFAVAALLALLSGRPGWAVAAIVAGVLVRLFSGVGILGLLVAGRRFVVVAAVAAAVLFGGFQWAAGGSPFSAGYDYRGEASWAPAYVVDDDRTGDGDWLVRGRMAKATMPATPARDWPNLIAYSLVVLGITFVFMPPFVVIVGLWALWARRDTAGARFTWWWLAGSVAVALPYFFQSPRFLAPAMMMVLVYTAVGIVDLCRTRGRFVHRRSTVSPPEGAGVPELASR